MPFLRQNKWAWTVFFLFVLIPPVMAMAGLLRHRPQRPPQPPQPQPHAQPPPARNGPGRPFAAAHREASARRWPRPAGGKLSEPARPLPLRRTGC